MAGERGSRRGGDSAWLAVFAALVVGGLAAGLVLSRGNDAPPVPTYSPEPTLDAGPTAPSTTPGDDAGDEPSPSGSPAVDERKAAFGHVHAIARSGRGLLLAAEDGLWTLGPDGPRRVEGVRHRLSTLLRRADGTLLASGLSADGAPLGVIASRDEGRTWTTAWEGRAAFRRLREHDGAVYGWEVSTGRLVRSTDLRTWEERSAVEGLLDFAVHPQDAAWMVRAVPEDGVGLPEVQESRDGGRTWKRIAAPSISLFAWPAGTSLWGAGEDGTVFFSADRGYSWSPRSILPAPPTAIEANGDTVYAALREVGVYRSGDRGKTWQRIDR